MASGLGRRLGLFPVAQRFGIRQTSTESPALLYPSLAQRAAEHTHLPWRDSAWLMRLFTELTFSHVLEVSRIDELSRRAFYEFYCLKERWSVRNLQRQQDSLLFERIGLSEKRDEILELARQGTAPNTRSYVRGWPSAYIGSTSWRDTCVGATVRGLAF